MGLIVARISSSPARRGFGGFPPGWQSGDYVLFFARRTPAAPVPAAGGHPRTLHRPSRDSPAAGADQPSTATPTGDQSSSSGSPASCCSSSRGAHSTSSAPAAASCSSSSSGGCARRRRGGAHGSGAKASRSRSGTPSRSRSCSPWHHYTSAIGSGAHDYHAKPTAGRHHDSRTWNDDSAVASSWQHYAWARGRGSRHRNGRSDERRGGGGRCGVAPQV